MSSSLSLLCIGVKPSNKNNKIDQYLKVMISEDTCNSNEQLDM